MELKGTDNSFWEVKSEQNSKAVRVLRMNKVQDTRLSEMCVSPLLLCSQSQLLTAKRKDRELNRVEPTGFPLSQLLLLPAQPRGLFIEV